MGEAKRKRGAFCRCGSGKPAGACCLTDRGWHKSPTVLDLTATGHVGRHDACYLRDANSCCDKITSEHLVSKTVLRVLADQKIEIAGFPWLDGQSKVLPFDSLISNCLCKAHNSALSDIDAVGGQFFLAFQKCGTTTRGKNRTFLFSGHDIERWFLRTLAAMAVSKNFSIDGSHLDDALHPDVNLLELLQDMNRWQPPLGMYVLQSFGETFRREDRLSLAPLVVPGTGKISGIAANIQGLKIRLMAATGVEEQATDFARAMYRPGKVIFKMGDVTHMIQMCWEDALEHMEITLSRYGSQ